MSDAATNEELEDVLSSIRRLIGDGGKNTASLDIPSLDVALAPPGNTASQVQPATDVAEEPVDKLVLTPSLMVVGGCSDEIANPVDIAVNPDAGQQNENSTTPDATTATDIKMQDKGEQPAERPLEDIADQPLPDRRSVLAAQIAELEAAIAGADQDYEPDGSEVVEHGVQWPARKPAPVETLPDAETVPGDADEAALAEELKDDVLTLSEADKVVDDGTGFFDPQELDEVVDEVIARARGQVDDVRLREMVAQVVHEELAGPLGERITRNMRRMVRREISNILSSRDMG